jgi:hypothetical protein
MGAVTLSVSFFTNAGVVDVEGGVLNLACGGSSTGNFDVDAGATLKFTGGTHTLLDGANFTDPAGLVQVAGGILVINGIVTTEQNFSVVNGVLEISPTGRLAVGGNYTQTGGVLQYDVASSSGYGQFGVTGLASLGGNLRIRFLSPYTPGPGDNFQVLTYGSRSGNFGYDFPSLSGVHLEAAFDPPDDPLVSGSLTIRTVPN